MLHTRSDASRSPGERSCIVALTAAALALALVIAPATFTPTEACAPAPRENTKVFIAEEAAIIVWDAAGKTQHFIRRASFETRAEKESLASRDFGFLVPTPTVPELAEASDAAFATMATVMQPAVVHENRYKVGSFLLSMMLLSKADHAPKVAAGGDVRILHTQRVAGYDAVVLEADHAESLNVWLHKHGYAARATLTDWLRPYVAAKWKLTAFKIAPADDKKANDDGKKRGDRAVSTSSVRMSFKTERPFFPYREPSDQIQLTKEFHENRLLQVFFIGTARMSGELGKAPMPWPAATKWAGQIPQQHLDALAGHLKLTAAQLPASPWLTAFEDRSPQRASGEDLFFSTASDQTPLSPPPIRYYHDVLIPIEGIVLALLLLGLVIWLILRWKRSKAA